MTAIDELRYALDTFYVLVSGALVMWMAAGFAMLEAGLVRARNTAEILTKNVALYAIACLMYLVFGYGFMYGPTESVWLPAAPWPTIGFAESDGAGFAPMADFFFQAVFVATAMSIVSGAVAERMKLWVFFGFCVILTGFIYPVQGFWQWGGGFLKEAGFHDFAGSGVVHLCGASAAALAAWLLGPRRGKYGVDGRIRAIPGANLPLATVGTLILWFGWFGFNGGSVLAIGSTSAAGTVARVFVNTNMAAAGGLVAVLIVARTFFGKTDLTLVLNGALAGLVAITADPVSPAPVVAVLVGAVGGLLATASIVTLDRVKLDDPVGAISVHGVAGIWGLMAVPITNEGAAFLTQLLGIGVISGWTLAGSLLVLWPLHRWIGLRVTADEELEGLDMGECGVEAYPEFTRSGS